jgi:GTP-binding protein
MEIKSASFVISHSKLIKEGKQSLAEIAFIGRSNVGKSSLINMLTNNSKLAKTSSTPGKTKLINYFLINKSWYIVDLPGYGYAQVSKAQRDDFRKMINNYLLHSENLYCVFVLIDSRIAPQKIDVEFINFLGENDVPFEIIYTKIDKQSQKKTLDNINLMRQTLSERWEELPNIMLSSSITKLGKEDILNRIENIINL